MYLNRFASLQRQMSDGIVRVGRGKTVIPLRIRNPDRSALIRQLWDDRIRTTYSTTSNTTTTTQTPATYKPMERTMSDSYCEALLPFKDDVDLRSDYVNMYGGIRFGKVLEDLDAMAATVAYLHCGQPEMGDFPMTILTAAVDRIELQGAMPSDCNLRLRGMVTWVGNSSMEISLGVDREDRTDHYVQAAMARFIMVARTHDGKHPFHINTLTVTDNGEENKVIESGNRAAEQRKAKKALKQEPPTAEESRLLHSIFLAKASIAYKPIIHTTMRTVRVCHPQERNLHNLVFGGILMREAFELAFATSAVYCQGRPLFLAIDELAFVHPVPIGSILEFTSCIVYTEAQDKAVLMHVQVIADVINVVTQSRVTTKTFHLTFKHNADDGMFPRPVLPDTYEEGVLYVEGRRRIASACEDPRPDPFRATDRA